MPGYELINDAGSNSVRRIGELNITGNVIPMTWFDHLRYPNGKPHVNAIIILADIVFWYRPIETRDEQTGMRMNDRKKFEGTYLQRTRSSYAKQYGLTNKQAKDAFNFLEEKGVINIIVAKSMTTKEGKRLGNVPYIDLNAEKIAEFNQPLVPVGPRLGTYKSEPLVPVGPTNTETTSTERLYTESTKRIQREKSHNDFSRSPAERAQQPALLPIEVLEPLPNTPPVDARKPRQEQGQTNSNTQPILKAYLDCLGYKPANTGKEAKAAKAIAAAGYTPEQVTTAYKLVKQQTFWQNKHLCLASVHENIGPLLPQITVILQSSPVTGYRHTEQGVFLNI